MAAGAAEGVGRTACERLARNGWKDGGAVAGSGLLPPRGSVRTP